MSLARNWLVFGALTVACLGCGSNASKPPIEQDVSRGLLGAYYYSWYDSNRWAQEAITDTPLLDRYQSNSREVARQHVGWAKRADLDFFMVSWVKPHDHQEQNFQSAVLPVIAEHRFHFAMLYETAMCLDLTASKTLDFETKDAEGKPAGERFLAHIDHLAANYFKHPNYQRLDGKALLTIYLVRDIVGAGPYFAKARQRLKEQGIELYLIADVVYLGDPASYDWQFLQENFNAITAYNMYHEALNESEYLQYVAEQFAAADRAAREHGLAFIPNVQPGYNDSPLRRLDGPARMILDRRRGDFYRGMWEIADRSINADQRMMLLTSFNEWHEGTEIEPSAQYGEQYIELTKEFAALTRVRFGLPRPPKED